MIRQSIAQNWDQYEEAHSSHERRKSPDQKHWLHLITNKWLNSPQNTSVHLLFTYNLHNIMTKRTSHSVWTVMFTLQKWQRWGKAETRTNKLLHSLKLLRRFWEFCQHVAVGRTAVDKTRTPVTFGACSLLRELAAAAKRFTCFFSNGMGNLSAGVAINVRFQSLA